MPATERSCCQYVLRAGSLTGRDQSYGVQRCLAQVEDGQVYCPVHRGVTAQRQPRGRAKRSRWFVWDENDGDVAGTVVVD